MSTHNSMADFYPRLPDAKKILVLRPNAIGDFMFALPALHALRHAYPKTRIVLLGKPWHAEFLRDRPGPVDEVIVMPPVPGVGAPPDAKPDTDRIGRFVESVREMEFDIALQMYGGGRYSNAFINQLGATLTAGLKTPDAEPLDRWLPYGDFANRRLELLQVAALVGAGPQPFVQEVTVTDHDRRAAAALVAPDLGQRLVVLHPGASDVRRHWPAERFAQVGDALASQGATIVISATDAEGHLARTIAQTMRHPAIDLTGRMSLSALCGMLERAVMMVSNDTGPLHLALGIGTPSVGIFWFSNRLESCPLRQHLLRAAMSVQIHCPVCGADNRINRCAHDVCFVADVSVEEITTLALALYDETAAASRAAAAVPAQAPRRPSPRQGPTRSGAVGGRVVPSAPYRSC